ncbi:hypothetical protein XS74_17035, partial [Salmonella enterica subsp. enterica]|nr:hypothetical protein [Salmonella enterica subsp. enterica]
KRRALSEDRAFCFICSLSVSALLRRTNPPGADLHVAQQRPGWRLRLTLPTGIIPPAKLALFVEPIRAKPTQSLMMNYPLHLLI